MSDSDKIFGVFGENDSAGGITGSIYTAAKSMNPFLYFFLFFIIMLLNTDIFITRVLARINGAVDQATKSTTFKGTVINSLLTVLIYIIADLLNRTGVI